MFIKWGQLQMNINCQAYQILLAWSRSCLGCVRANLSWHLWPVEVWLIPCSGSCNQDWGPSLPHTGTTQVWNEKFFLIQWQVLFLEFTATSNWLLSVLRLHPLEEEGFITVMIEEGDKQLKTRRSLISVNITICWSFLTQNNWECFLCLTNQLKRIVYKISEILENKL